MVDITPRIPQGKQLISRYGGGSFTVSGKEFHTSIIVLPDVTIEWQVSSMEEISLENLSPVIDNYENIDLLIIGAGTAMQPVSAQIRRELKEKNIVIEVMDTGAACRTYNVLLSEERKIAAVLIKI